MTQLFIYEVPFKILRPKLLTSTGLLKNFTKVVKLLQPAVLSIFDKERPLLYAVDVDAERVARALNVFAFIPVFPRVSTTQQAIAFGVTGAYGAT